MELYNDKEIILYADEDNLYITNLKYNKAELFYFTKEMDFNFFKQVTEKLEVTLLDSGKIDLEELDNSTSLNEVINYEIKNTNDLDKALVEVTGIKNSKFRDIMVKGDSKFVEFNSFEDILNDFCFWLENDNNDILNLNQKKKLANLYFGLFKMSACEKFSIDSIKECNNEINIDLDQAKENYQKIEKLQSHGVKVFRK